MGSFKEIKSEKQIVLLPSNWIKLDGVFTPNELRTIANEVERNYKRIIKKANGNKNRHI